MRSSPTVHATWRDVGPPGIGESHFVHVWSARERDQTSSRMMPPVPGTCGSQPPKTRISLPEGLMADAPARRDTEATAGLDLCDEAACEHAEELAEVHGEPMQFPRALSWIWHLWYTMQNERFIVMAIQVVAAFLGLLLSPAFAIETPSPRRVP